MPILFISVPNSLKLLKCFSVHSGQSTSYIGMWVQSGTQRTVLAQTKPAAHPSDGRDARQPARGGDSARHEPGLPVQGGPHAHDGPLRRRPARLQRLAARRDADRAYVRAGCPQVRQPALQLLCIYMGTKISTMSSQSV